MILHYIDVASGISPFDSAVKVPESALKPKHGAFSTQRARIYTEIL